MGAASREGRANQTLALQDEHGGMSDGRGKSVPSRGIQLCRDLEQEAQTTACLGARGQSQQGQGWAVASPQGWLPSESKRLGGARAPQAAWGEGGQQLPCGVLGIVLDEMVGCCRRKEW